MKILALCQKCWGFNKILALYLNVGAVLTCWCFIEMVHYGNVGALFAHY
jgi:hypothetical protein